MVNERDTTIGIGKTDGFRYVGVTPPLNNRELNVVRDAGSTEGMPAFTVVTSPACTLFQLGEAQLAGRNRDEVAARVANDIFEALSQVRRQIRLQSKVVHLGYGSQTSPFNPDTGE